MSLQSLGHRCTQGFPHAMGRFSNKWPQDSHGNHHLQVRRVLPYMLELEGAVRATDAKPVQVHSS
jgi:hypothetical protein